MKVLTLHQPWASLVALGVKSIETRSWSTSYRGPLAINAGAKMPRVGSKVGAFEVTSVFHGRGPRMRQSGGDLYPMPLGAIVATCTLVDVVPMVGWRNAANNVGREVCWDGERWLHPTSDEAQRLVRRNSARLALPDERGMEWQDGHGRVTLVEDQRPYGDFTAGRFAWLLADMVPVDPPVPFKGAQGLTRTWAP